MNPTKPLLSAVCHLEESCLVCKAKQLALSAIELHTGLQRRESVTWCSGNQGGLGVWTANMKAERKEGWSQPIFQIGQSLGVRGRNNERQGQDVQFRLHWRVTTSEGFWARDAWHEVKITRGPSIHHPMYTKVIVFLQWIISPFYRLGNWGLKRLETYPRKPKYSKSEIWA